MGSRFSDSKLRKATGIATAIVTAGAVYSIDAQDIVPLPTDIFDNPPPSSNPAMDLTERVISDSPLSLNPEIPDTFTISNEGGEIAYDSDKRILSYKGNSTPIKLITNEGLDVTATELQVDLEKKNIYLKGPLTIYQGESLTLAETAVYDWEKGHLDAQNIRSKVTGILVRGSRVEYQLDSEGKRFMRIHDSYASTDDAEDPDVWVGAGEMTIYPGDYGRVTRLSLASGDTDVPVPVLGWFSFSHSLNPREGYMPDLGSRSSWGAYLLNSYGFLIGNRRVQGNIPVADYILTTHVDYRTRRGLASGIDLEDVSMRKKYPSMKGLQFYYIYDDSPNINPTRTKRIPVKHERYRVSMNTLWNLPLETAEPTVRWTMGTNINLVSDRYVLRDYFDEISKINDKPDNTARIVRRGQLSQTMLMTRFAPNDYYATDERAEISYYRARTAIGKTGITYETRNSFGFMRQEIPGLDKKNYKWKLKREKDPDARSYYQRLLDTHGFMRANSTHEFARHFNVLKFLNITPKAGAGYSGYYSVENTGADNRFIGFAGVDVNIKLHRNYDSFHIPSMGYKGLTHIIKPYTTLAHCNISSANPLVPQLDAWSNEFSTTTSNPIELDLLGFTSIDSWGTWSIWRIGVENILYTTVDDEPLQLFKWTSFVDYNEENPHSDSAFSNLYSLVTFRPSQQFSIRAETQTPTINNGDGYHEYNIGAAWQPLAALETKISYRMLRGHPVQANEEQLVLQTNLRINEKYSACCKWNWNIKKNRFSIQQYSLFKKSGAWYLGATIFLRNNGGKKETGFGLSFTLGETGTALPVDFF